MSETVQIEVNGVKMEVDTRHARRIDTIKIGTKVKVRLKENYEPERVYPGVVVGFEPFPSRPTIIIAYIKHTYTQTGLAFLYYNEDTKDAEVIVSHDQDFSVDRDAVLDWFERQEQKHLNELAELKAKKEFFERNFAVYWDQLDTSELKRIPFDG